MATAALPFDELLSFVVDNRGRTCPTASTGLPLIATNCVSNEHLYPTKENVRYVDQDTYDNWFRAHPKPGDILFVLKGAPGRCALVPDPVDFCIAQDMVAVRADREKIDPKYLFAALRSPLIQESIDRMHVGTMIPHFKKGDFNKLLIPIPDRHIQEFIGSAHMALVEKIELNRRMNETLEATARAIFKDWFVDFGPTRAKLDGRAPYFTADIWSLFPDRLDDEGKPEGWANVQLAQVADIVKGRSYKSEELQPSRTALVTLKSFARGGGYRSEGLKSYKGSYKPNQVVSEGDLIVALTDVTQAAELIGRPARVLADPRFDTLVASLDVAIIRPKEESLVTREFLFGTMATEEFTVHTYAHTSGTTVLHLSKDAIPSFRFNVPNSRLVSAFEESAGPLFARIAANERESRTLATTRDFLLPKLMSGEVRVKDAEMLVGETT